MTNCPFTAEAALYMERSADWEPVSPLTTIGLWSNDLSAISDAIVRMGELGEDAGLSLPGGSGVTSSR
mgnify:CR=1 FL=1